MDVNELTGRGDLFATLSDAISASVDRSDAILLVGEPGIGKTACLLAVADLARTAGHQVLETAGSEAEINLPFAGLHRLLRPLLPLANALPDVQYRALLAALGMREGGPADPFVVAVATLTLIREAAERCALVLNADDVQWLDEQSRHVLAFVARRLEDSPVLMVATSPSPQRLPEIRDAFREVHLGRLDKSAAHRVLLRIARDFTPPQRDRLVSQALGNPLALVELAKTSLSGPTKRTNPLTPTVSLTPALEAAFSRRWTDLPETSQAAVLVAALDADASLQEILAASTRLCQIEVTIAVLEPAQALGLLSFHETRVRFSHPLVMAAIAQKQAISRTQAAHRALGEVVAVNSHRRAWHRALGSAALDDAIATELEATTRGSIHRGGTETAIMALERAAQLSTVPAERGRRLLLAAKHAFRLGRADLAVRLLSTVAGIELSDFDRVRAELLREELEGSVIDASNRVMQLCDVAQRAAGAGEMELALEVAYAAARRRCTAPVDAHACAATVSVARNLDRLSGDARVLAVFALADPIGQGRVVLSALDEIAALGEIADLNDHELDADALGAYAVAARAVGHYSFALALFDRAESELRSGRLFGALARNLCAAADLRLELGEWERAADALAEFQTLSSASMSANHRAAALATTAKAAALRGECTRALELVAETEHSPAARSGSSYLARAQIVRGIAHISSGHHGDAFAALHRVFEPDDPSSHFREQFGAVGYLAEAAVQSGNRDQARAVVDRMQLIADVSGSPVLITQLAYAKAILAPDDAAEGLFIAALASDSACAPWPRARLQLAYGRWLRRQQRVTQSRGPLQAALTTLQRIGARRWAEEASDELEASGVNGPDRAEGQGFNILSAQESKIARLVAQGLSNREIGQQLYLLPRTVSSHLYRMFPKLGISTRTQLASRLDEHELAAPNGT